MRGYFFTRKDTGDDWVLTNATTLGGLKQVATVRKHTQIGGLEGDKVVLVLQNKVKTITSKTWDLVDKGFDL